jgi:hypothetical protein
MEQSKKYPLTGFSKISFEEFMGILSVLRVFGELSKEKQEQIMLMMDGMKYRAMQRE